MVLLIFVGPPSVVFLTLRDVARYRGGNAVAAGASPPSPVLLAHQDGLDIQATDQASKSADMGIQS
jgi:hypothetical protein